MSKISEKVLEQIDACKICPKPKWHFLLRNYVVWTAFIITVILGSLSFSVIVEMLATGDWDIYKYSGKSFLEFCLLIFPVSWMIFLIIFAFLAYYNWKHTKHGYRYRTYAIMLLSVGASGVLGFVLYNVGLGKKVDAMATRSVPFYHKSKDEAKESLWLQPDRGLLSGEIVEINDEKNFIIKDSSGNTWDVQITEETIKHECCKRKGKSVRIIGKKQKGDQKEEFVAREIRIDDGDDDEDDNDFILRKEIENNGKRDTKNRE